VADATILEKSGIPAACLITNPFVRAAEAMARRNHFPSYRVALVPHPIGNLAPDQVRRRALEVLPQVVDILGLA
jgi:hypothetical protein